MRIIHLRITVKENVTLLQFTPYELTLLFADIDRPIGFVIYHINPTEDLVIFESDEHITELFKLEGTTKWMVPTQILLWRGLDQNFYW